MLPRSPAPLPLQLIRDHFPPAPCISRGYQKKRKEVEEKKGSSLQQMLGKDLMGLNSILSDCFSLLPIVLGLFYKPSYLDHLCVWNPGSLTPRSSHFLCENSKFRYRTMWPVDHKLLSQNKFIMPLCPRVTDTLGKPLQQAWQKQCVPILYIFM